MASLGTELLTQKVPVMLQTCQSGSSSWSGNRTSRPGQAWRASLASPTCQPRPSRQIYCTGPGATPSGREVRTCKERRVPNKMARDETEVGRGRGLKVCSLFFLKQKRSVGS